MKRALNKITKVAFGVVVVGLMTVGLSVDNVRSQVDGPPFGRKPDIDYGSSLWSALEKAHLVGANMILSGLYKGGPPHGDVLETLQSTVTVSGHTGTTIVKRNYGGPDLSVAAVNGNREKHLKWITVMFKREKGYDAENQDWFWAKYSPTGGYDQHPEAKVPLAGKVGSRKAKAGCIGCHAGAPGGDMVFFNSAVQ